jgi:SWI/SNF-related matrix-associated actin-dependent regulator of chromatin subfamily A-like protein 1
MIDQRRTAIMAENEKGDRVIQIKFPYDLDLIFKVRSLPGRRYYSEDHCWSAPLYIESINHLINWGFTLDFRIEQFLENANNRTKKISALNGISGLKGTLRHFQSEGVAFIEDRDGRALLADEMGLGKTVEALAWVQLHREKVPVMVLVPGGLKLNWAQEIENWLPDSQSEVLNGQTPWMPTADIFILNYDILAYWLEEIVKLKPQILIIDEAHKIKTDAARRTRALKHLLKRIKIPHIIGISGTPIENRPIEIFNITHIIKPDLFPNRLDFIQRYCKPKYTSRGWDYNGASRTGELHEKLVGTIMIRRLKKDVLPELPPKISTFVPLYLSNEKDYRSAERDFISFVRQEKGEEAAKRASNAEALATIEGLKQLAVKGVLKEAINWIKDFIEVEGKLVVFATHKEVIDAIMNEFGHHIAVAVDGRTVISDRQRAKDIFQHNPEVKLFVGNIEAAGEGITLTAASNVVFLELPWTPSKLKQAVDRLHRIGQLYAVNIWYLLAKGTIVDKIARILDAKMEVVEAVIDGTVPETESMLSEILKLYKI